MTRYHASSYTVLPISFNAQVLSGDWSQILRNAKNELWKTHKFPLDSQCNDGYPGSIGEVLKT